MLFHRLTHFLLLNLMKVCFYEQQNISNLEDGSEWVLEYKNGDDWVTVNSVNELPSSYTVQFTPNLTLGSVFSAGAQILKNGQPWSTTSLHRSYQDSNGSLEVNVDFEANVNLPRKYTFKFDRITGKEIVD